MPYRFILLLICCAVCIKTTTAQNLFPNPGFEDFNICVEYNALCAPEGWFYIRPATNPLVNRREVPAPLMGENHLLVPVENVYCNKTFEATFCHAFVYTMLGCPLVKDESYTLSFYINTSRRKFYSLDFYFTPKEPATKGFDVFHPTQTVTIKDDEPEGDIKNGWRKVTHSFKATGGEKYCIIGNFSPTQWGFKPGERMNTGGAVYYFLDELSIVSDSKLPLCNSFTENLAKIYEQNYRHSEYIVVGDYPEPVMQPTPEPVFVTDTITVPAVFFETNSAVLKPAFKKILDSLAVILNDKKIAKIDIAGHTDSRGTPEKNKLLSSNRAEAVKVYLANKLPHYGDIIFAEGKGQDEPIDDNNTEKGRTKNRRVEIILTTTGLK